jgi:hypothetical protein
LTSLARWLTDRHYSQHAVEAIVLHAMVEGTPTGCPYLESEDEAEASEAFVDGMAPVDYRSAAWGPSLVATPPELDGWDCPPPYEPTAADLAEMAEWFDMPPLSGGSPDAGGSYVPTDEDIADADEVCRRLDREMAEWRAENARNPQFGYE